MVQPVRSTLRATSEQHHALLLPHVDRLLALAEMVGRVDCAGLHLLLDEEVEFVRGQFLPHMDAVEATLYGRLEALMGPRHTMAPMREEHATLRGLVAELGAFVGPSEPCGWSELEGLTLRRILYRLHALLKMHLAEEELYLGVLDRSLSAEEKDRLALGLDHTGVNPA